MRFKKNGGNVIKQRLCMVCARLKCTLSFVLALTLMIGIGSQPQAARIKDLADIAGVRSNQLLGYGLVVGLDGSGDKDSAAPYTIQSSDRCSPSWV